MALPGDLELPNFDRSPFRERVDPAHEDSKAAAGCARAQELKANPDGHEDGYMMRNPQFAKEIDLIIKNCKGADQAFGEYSPATGKK